MGGGWGGGLGVGRGEETGLEVGVGLEDGEGLRVADMLGEGVPETGSCPGERYSKGPFTPYGKYGYTPFRPDPEV